MELNRYRHEDGWSCTLGAALTIELIRRRRELARRVYVHPDYRPGEESGDLFRICERERVPLEINRKIFSRLAAKGNTWVIGIFDKFPAGVDKNGPHIVLVNPGDCGNLGTILRTGLGFEFRDYIVIRPGADLFDPKTVRSSMGALFHVRYAYYDSFERYRQEFLEREIFSFMLDGALRLDEISSPPQHAFSLVFGNEGSGLPAVFHSYGTSVRIVHNREVDSLNLAVAFGIGASAFARLPASLRLR